MPLVRGQLDKESSLDGRWETDLPRSSSRCRYGESLTRKFPKGPRITGSAPASPGQRRCPLSAGLLALPFQLPP